MKITSYKPEQPIEIIMAFNRDEAWAIIAAIRTYGDMHPGAAKRAVWIDWADQITEKLR